MQPTDKGISTLKITLMVGAVMLAVTAVGVLMWHSHGAAQLSSSPGVLPTEEQKAYLPRLEFSDAHMSAAENFLGATVTYLDAKVTNKGGRTLNRLDVDLTFVDTLNQVVLRERVHPVTPRTAPLPPGESRVFHITFEHMPVDWNQAAPAMLPVYVQFE
jgi:flagellar basal body-associated protein FliL